MLPSLCRSARQQAVTLGLKDSSIERLLHKDLCCEPYKLQVAQELGEQEDTVNQRQFCNQSLGLNNNRNFVNALLMSDEVHFHVSGYVNKQNCRFWASDNLHELHQRPLHNAKMTVWCTISSGGIIGPYFSEDKKGQTVTIDAEWYTAMLETFLWNELNRHQYNLLWFQQDGATAHSAWISVVILVGVSRQTHFLFQGHQLACLLTWSFDIRLLSLGLHQKQSIGNTSCQFCWLETANLGVHSQSS